MHSKHEIKTTSTDCYPRVLAIVFLLSIVGLFLWSFFKGGLAAIALSTSVPSEEKVIALRAAFAAWGVFAPLAYLLLVIIEVVIAPIPGTLLYLPGGMLFGGFWGGTLSLLGNTIGAGASCLFMRSLLGPVARHKLTQHPFFVRYRNRIDRHGMGIIILLRVNPLTSSDLVSYAAGPTRISLRHVMLGTLLGMAPLCYLQSYLSMSLFEAFPWLIWPLVGVSAIYLAILFWIVWMAGKKKTVRSPSTANNADKIQ